MVVQKKFTTGDKGLIGPKGLALNPTYCLVKMCIISHFFKMENVVTKSDRLSRSDENVCILHDNTQNVFLGINEKYETLSIYVTDEAVTS